MVKEPKNMLHGKSATKAKEKAEVIGTFELMPLAKRKTAAASTLRGYIDRLEAALVTATTLSENQHAAIAQYRTRVNSEGKARDELMMHVRQQSDEIDKLHREAKENRERIDTLKTDYFGAMKHVEDLRAQRDAAETRERTYRKALAIISGNEEA